MDDEDLGPLRICVGGMDVQRAQPSPEGDLLVDVHRLAAGDDHTPVGNQPEESVDAGVVERVQLLRWGSRRRSAG